MLEDDTRRWLAGLTLPDDSPLPTAILMVARQLDSAFQTSTMAVYAKLQKQVEEAAHAHAAPMLPGADLLGPA